MSQHYLEIDSNEKLDDAWSVVAPPEYEVQLLEPMKKSLTVAAVATVAWKMKLVLDGVQLTDWALGKIYDKAWDQIKERFKHTTKKPTQGTLTIQSSADTGNVTVEFNAMSEAALDRAKLEVKKEIETNADGSQKITSTVKIKL